MIKPPSVQSEYSMVFSGDPALDLPEDADARELALKNARETGNWPLKDGQAATVFDFAPLSREQLGWLLGENQHSTEHGRPLSALELDDLTVRLAIRGVSNFGSVKVVRKRQPSGQWLADRNVLEAMHGACGSTIVSEFASQIIERATATIRPL